MKRGSIRPGGRTERVRQSVANAVLQLIKDGKTDFTITDVAEYSGIARSTIYARWPGREQLLVHLVEERELSAKERAALRAVLQEETS